jgi:hypothetical protein
MIMMILHGMRKKREKSHQQSRHTEEKGGKKEHSHQMTVTTKYMMTEAQPHVRAEGLGDLM